MPKSKFRENLVKMRCSVCKRFNYYTRRKKNQEKKLELKKYCKWCKKHTLHKEAKV